MNGRMKAWIGGALLAIVQSAFPAGNANGDIDDLLALDINRLLDVKVTLAGRIEESAFAVPAAIYVLDREQILRSGHRRLPEILRMVPGMHVGKWDSNKWAVSSRNAMSRFASTMLVMIDGRHVYTPLYGGVRWEIQDVLLEDIERIEVIRGPGGPLWGSNAVDGIINVITRSAKDTQGTMMQAGVGKGEMKYETAVRHGGKTEGGVNFRVFAKTWQTDRGEYLDPSISTHNSRRTPGDTADDAGKSWLTGFRADWEDGSTDRYSVQANVSNSLFNEERATGGNVLPNQMRYRTGNLMFHWRRQLGEHESLELRSALDHVSLGDDILRESQSIFDLDLQHSFRVGMHTVTWGGGYRYYRSDVRPPSGVACNSCFNVYPSVGRNQTISAFVQDQMAINDRLTVILGSKFEQSNYSDFESQPTARISWRPEDQQTVWAAVTRAVRTPTRLDHDRALLNVPPALAPVFGCLVYQNGVCQLGNPDAEAWRIVSKELGYRFRPSSRWSVDLTGFHNRFHKVIQGIDTLGRHEVKGVEGVLRFQPMANWQMEVNGTWHTARDILSNGTIADTPLLPARTAHFRSQARLSEQFDLDVMLYYASELKRNNLSPIPAYTRLDLRFGWRPQKDVDLSLWLTNLTDSVHPEYIEGLKVNTGVRRGALLNLTVRY